MSDVELKVGSDAGDLLKGLKQAREELIAMREAAEKAKKELADSMQSGVKATQAFEAEIQRLLSLQKAQADYIDKLNRKIAEYETALSKSMNSAQVEKLIKKIEALQAEVEKLKKELAALTAAQNSNTEAGKKNNDVTQKNSYLQKLLAKILGETTKAAGSLGKVFSGFLTGGVIGWFTSFISILEIFNKTTYDASKEMEKLNDELEKQKQLLSDNLELVDNKTKLDLERLKRAGATDFELGNREVLGMMRQMNFLTKAADEAEKRLIKNKKLRKGESNEEFEERIEKYQDELEKANRAIEKQQAAIDLKRSQNITKLWDDRKKEEEKNAKEREAAAKRAAKEEEDRLRRLFALEKELAYARIENMEEGKAKELLKEDLNYLYVIKDLELKKRKASQAEIKIIEQLAVQQLINTNAKKLKINTKYTEDVAKLMTELQDSILDVSQQGEVLEIRQVNEKYDKIVKAIDDARKKLKAAGIKEGSDEYNILNTQSAEVEAARLKAISDVTNKWALDRVEKAEAIAIAENAILEKSGLKGKVLEELKEKNRLKIVIDYGKKKLALLEAIGGEENRLQILQIKKAIQDAQKSLAELNKKPFSLLSLLGLDKLSSDEQKALNGSLGLLKSSLSEITNSLTTIQDNAIDKSRERINQIEDEIRAQEDAVKKAKDLAAEGYANNLAMEERKLATLKAKKVAEQQIEKEALEKKKEMQRTQLLIDSATQASSLATAIANIIKVYSSLPFGGQVLAAAAIAGSVAAFTYGRIQAFKAINTTTAKTGRRVSKGKRHSEGGNKYLSMDSNDPHIFEIEEGEWVTNRDSSKKYDPILEAINNDTLDKLNRFQLGRMLKPYGIHLEAEASGRISKKVEASATGNIVVINSPNNDDANWEKQNNILKGIGTKEKTVEYVPGYRIERDGNRVRKIKVNDKA